MYKFYKPKNEKADPVNVFVVVPEIEANPGNVVIYSPIGQHGEASKDYIKEDCIEIKMSTYKKVSSGIYTPKEYLITKEIEDRFKYLKGEIKKECISYGEIAELQSLAEYIPEDDVLLREWAGIPEFEE
jgi:hypothetical protein